MKLIIDISEGIYKHVDTIQNGSIGAKQIINSVKNGIPAYKAIPSAEPTVAQERYEDLCEYFGCAKDILNNREDFKAWLGRIKWHIHKAEELYEKYEQEPKTGHWIKDKEPWGGRQGWKCNKCNHTYDINVVYSKMPYNFCPNCGARMVESQESEEQTE